VHAGVLAAAYRFASQQQQGSMCHAHRPPLSLLLQVDAGSGPPAGTAENIDLHLNLLRSAVASLGGEVRVLSAGSGVAVLGYRGPPAIGRGLVAAVKDAFKDIREVVLKDLPPEEGEQQQQQQPPPSSKAGSS
jgi:hypothetical protein